MLKTAPKEPFILFAIAQEYTKMGELNEAIVYLEKLITSSPNYSGAYYHLGKLYEQSERLNDAIAVYKKGMEITKIQGELHAFNELQSALSIINDEA